MRLPPATKFSLLLPLGFSRFFNPSLPHISFVASRTPLAANPFPSFLPAAARDPNLDRKTLLRTLRIRKTSLSPKRSRVGKSRKERGRTAKGEREECRQTECSRIASNSMVSRSRGHEGKIDRSWGSSRASEGARLLAGDRIYVHGMGKYRRTIDAVHTKDRRPCGGS